MLVTCWVGVAKACAMLQYLVMTERRRLADAMNERRLELRLQWNDVAERADISTETLRKVRHDQPMSPLTQTNLEHALQWERCSIDTILDGGEPIPTESREELPGSSFEERERARQEKVDELVSRLDDITRELKELQQEPGSDRRNSA